MHQVGSLSPVISKVRQLPAPTQAWRQGRDPCTLDRWCGVSCWASWCGMGGKQVAVWASWWWVIFWYFLMSFFSTCLIISICVYYESIYLFFMFFIYWIILTYVFVFFFWNYVDTASTTLLLGCHGVTTKSWLHPQAWSLFQAPRLMSCVYLFLYICM